MTSILLKLAEEAGNLLHQKNLKITTAESCTGGALGYWITAIPGSSAWFEQGVIAYSNQAKIEMLAVQAVTLKKFGAVSEEVVQEMATGALKKSHADVSIAITGIAGPGGASIQKPVGLVWVAWASLHFSLIAEAQIFPGNREDIRLAAVKKSLEKLLILLS